MLARLQALDRMATDRGFDVLKMLEKEPKLLRQWLHFQDELLNRCVDLGFDTIKFHKKGVAKSSPKNGEDGATTEEKAPTIDWFELSFSLAFQLRIQRRGENARVFPLPLPRKFTDMWPRKKVAVIADEYDLIADSSVYGYLLAGMRKSAVRWCFTVDAFLSELEEIRLRAWKSSCEAVQIQEPSLDKRGIRREELVGAMRGICGTSAETSDSQLAQAIELATARLQIENYEDPASQRTSPTTIRLDVESRKRLEKLNALLCVDYRARRELAIERLDVTLQSFTWSKRGADTEQQMMIEVEYYRSQLSCEPHQVDLNTILAAEFEHSSVPREARLEEGVRLRSLVIGPVPDRGGRADELSEREIQQARQGQWKASFNYNSTASEKSEPSNKEQKSKMTKKNNSGVP